MIEKSSYLSPRRYLNYRWGVFIFTTLRARDAILHPATRRPPKGVTQWAGQELIRDASEAEPTLKDPIAEASLDDVGLLIRPTDNRQQRIPPYG
jgi:hypothetical protein